MNFSSSDDRRSATFVGLGSQTGERLLAVNLGLKASAGSLAQTRDNLVKQRVALKSRANNILDACGLNGIEELLSSEKKMGKVPELLRDGVVRMQLRVIIGQIRTLNRTIAELEWIIERAQGFRKPRRRVVRRVEIRGQHNVL